MTFGYPWLLLMLAVPAVLCFWELTRRGTPVAMPLDHGHHGDGRWLRRLVHAANFLPPLLLAIAIVVLARPLRLDSPKQERRLTNVEFVLDISTSMNGEFGEGSRYDGAMDAINRFTTHRRGDAFGLTVFGSDVLRWTPLTKDLSAIRSATPFVRPGELPSHFQGTRIGKAIRYTRKTLAERREDPEGGEIQKADSMIILLSDGESSDLFGSAARDIAGDLLVDNVRLFAIHIGRGSPPQQLYDLARPTGGEVYAANNPDGLTAVFKRIDEMQPVKLKPTARQKVDAFGPFALTGLALLGLCQLTLFGVRFAPW